MEKKRSSSFKELINRSLSNLYVSRLLILLSALMFFLIILNRQTNIIWRMSLLVQYKPYIAYPFIGIFLFFILSIKYKNLKRPASFLVVLTLFALSLAGVWANAQTENYFISGLIPRSDAGFQYAGVLRLLEFGELNGPASRRPFFGELLAMVLALTNRNLQFTIAIMVFLVAVSTWYAMLEVHDAFGRISSVLFLFLVTLFYSKFVGTTMTENLGLIFGLLSFAFFLRSMKMISVNKKTSGILFVFGTFLFSMGQNARPGAVLTIPLFVFLAGLMYRESKGSIKWKMIMVALLAALLPFLINQLHFAVNGFKGTIPMSNMGYGLYGFVTGGTGWNQIFTDHPDINNLSIANQNKQIFEYVFLEIIKNPENSLLGFLQEFRALFNINSQVGLLSFIQIEPSLPNLLVSIFVVLLYGLGLMRMLFKSRSLFGLFSLAIFIGFVLSLPFAPASQTMYMRVYAVSIPFLIFIALYGLNLVLSKFPIKSQLKKKPESLMQEDRIFSVILTLLIILSPVILLVLKTAPPKTLTECPQGQTTSFAFYNPNSAINVVEDAEIILNWVPNTHEASFRRTAHNICCKDDISFYKSLKAPFTIFSSIDNATGNNGYFVIADPEMVPDKAGWLQLCGSVTDIYGKPAADGFLFTETIYPLN